MLAVVKDSTVVQKNIYIVMFLVVYVFEQSNIYESIDAVCLGVYPALCINFKSVLPCSKLIQVDRCYHAFNVDGVN